MSMSRKHYREAAEIIKRQINAAQELTRAGSLYGGTAEATAVLIAKDLADMFKRDNSAFRYDTFFAAAGLDGFGDPKN